MYKRRLTLFPDGDLSLPGIRMTVSLTKVDDLFL